MIEQTFALSDIPRIFTLAFLEILLSADNAVVLGVLSSALPVPLRKKALFIGIVSAFVLRAVALLGVAVLLETIWFQLLGGAYLIYLAVRYLTQKRKSPELKPIHSFWKVVLLIELLDLVFAIDSIVAGVAFINGSFSKLWIVYLGGMIGIFGMRYAASLFASLLDRFPKLERSAYLMVGWIGIKLGISAFDWPLPPLLFWSVIAILFLLGFLKPKR
jgi:YkoY family integral membrane protein